MSPHQMSLHFFDKAKGSPQKGYRYPKQAAKGAGVKRVCIPAVGKPSAEQRAEQHQRWFRRGQRVRAGCEGRISVMKRRDGLARCLYRGPDGIQRWVAWGVVSNNLWVITTAGRPRRKQLLPTRVTRNA